MDPVTTQATAKAVEETAKASGKALDIVHDTGGYLSQVFGDLPANAVGILGADWLRERRFRNLDGLRRRTAEILRERDVGHPIELSPNQATELLMPAQEESRAELAELWARLLANAMDPSLNNVRHSFIEAVKLMDPLDATLLKFLYDQEISAIRNRSTQDKGVQDVQYISTTLSHRSDEIIVSLRHLETLTFFDKLGDPAYRHDFFVNATYREFMRACYPELRIDAKA